MQVQTAQEFSAQIQDASSYSCHDLPDIDTLLLKKINEVSGMLLPAWQSHVRICLTLAGSGGLLRMTSSPQLLTPLASLAPGADFTHLLGGPSDNDDLLVSVRCKHMACNWLQCQLP